MITEKYTLVEARDTPPLRFRASQGEAEARQIVLSLRTKSGNSVSANGATPYVYVLKPDGNPAVMEAQEVSGSPGTYTWTWSLQSCTCPGVSRVVLQLLSDTSDLRWTNMDLIVEPCDLEGAVASTPDLGPLASLLTVPDYIDQLGNAYETATAQLEALMGNFAPVGNWAADIQYQTLNIVSHQGYSYVANKPNIGVEPPNVDTWTLIGSKGDKGDPGQQGEQGNPGKAATVQVGAVYTGPAGSEAKVSNAGTDTAAVLQFTIPQGKQGEQGVPGEQGPPGTGLDIIDQYDSLELLEQAVTAPKPGDNYYVGAASPYDVYTYTATKGWVNNGKLQGAQGPEGQKGEPGTAATVRVGQVTTGEPGSNATVTNSGTESAALLDFSIPRGATGAKGDIGATPNITVGEVTTLEPGQQATASMTGTAENPVLNLGIPKGETGEAGQGGLTAADVIALIYPVGAIMPTTSNVNPGTYLTGTTWESFGAGKTLVGVDTADTDFDSAAKTGGAKTAWDGGHTHETRSHTLVESEIPQHAHSMTHTHGDTFSLADGGIHSHSYSGSTASNGPSGTFRVLGWKTAVANGDFETVSPYFDQKSAGSGTDFGSISINLDGAHTHTISGTTGNGGLHDHQFTGSVSQYSGGTGTYGGGDPHSHGGTTTAFVNVSTVQPYITCYFWRRTA